MEAEAFLDAKARKTEAALEAFMASCEGVPAKLLEAIRYSLFAGGKRLRPALALGAAEMVSGSDEAALEAACALEMLHTYSLVHDDLPCMDDDDLRRGKPSVHKAYDEATAVLVGDGLQAMAFELLATTGNAAVIEDVGRAVGAAGMVGGQFVDLESEGQELSLGSLQSLHRMKTGALIRASVRAGAMLGGADNDRIAALSAYGERLGLAFQIADDLLDVCGDEAETGKPVGSDASKNKATYPALLGLEEARQLARESADAAIAALDGFGAEAGAFRALADYVVQRRK